MDDAGTARERLIEGTRDLLWERGYSATSPRAILARSGVGQGSLYHHFAGKEPLAAAALQASSTELLAGAREILSFTGWSNLERVRRYLLRERDVLRGCPVGRMAGDADAMDSELLHATVRDTFDEVRGLLVNCLHDARQEGELSRTCDPAELADTVLAVVQGGYVLARAEGNPAPFHRAVRGAIALLDHSAGQQSPKATK